MDILKVSSNIMLLQVIISLKTTDSGGYLGITVPGEYVAKPPLSLWLYYPKTQRFS